MLIEKTENLCRRMRWKAHFFLNPDIGRRNKECYGFNSTKSPPHVSELENFESKMLEMIKNVQFKQVHCKFQKKLSTDIKNIKNTKSMFVPADKTTNFNKMDAESYNTLLQKNVTKSYKKIPPETITSVERISKSIATRLNLPDRINTTVQQEAFITLKDHKPNFQNNPTCRLINPSKSAKSASRSSIVSTEK